PGHRRRGLFRAMLLAHLRRSTARGEVFSVLNAAETGIYGRYGYGAATRSATMSLSRGVDLREVPGSTELSVELETVDQHRHLPIVDEVHRQVRRPGWIPRRSPALQAAQLVDLPSAQRGAEPLRIAIVRGR